MAPRKPCFSLLSLLSGLPERCPALHNVPWRTHVRHHRPVLPLLQKKQAGVIGWVSPTPTLSAPSSLEPSGSSQGNLTLKFHSGTTLLLSPLLCFPSCTFHSPRKAGDSVDTSSCSYGEETCLTSPRCQSVLSARRTQVTRTFLFSPVPSPSHGHTSFYSPSNMAGPTPTIMIDMGSEEACGRRMGGVSTCTRTVLAASVWITCSCEPKHTARIGCRLSLNA